MTDNTDLADAAIPAVEQPLEPAVDAAPTPARSAQPSRGLRAWLKAGGPAPAAAPQQRNPFLPPEPSAPEDEADDAAGWTPVVRVGPSAPTGAPSPEKPAVSVPDEFLHQGAAAPETPQLAVQVVGLHGGAGTSTVSALLGDTALDCGTGLRGLATADVPVLMVTRTHAHGLDLLRRAAAQFGAGELEQLRVLGVVLVDDGPTIPKDLQRTVRSLRRSLPYSWRVTWSEEVRRSSELPGPAKGGLLRRVRKSVLAKADELPPVAATAEPDTPDNRSTEAPKKGN